MPPSLTIVVPFYNEEGCVLTVLEEIRAAQPEAEIIAIDDGSTDNTARVLAGMSGIRIISFGRNRGQSAALYAGLRAASGEFIAMLDGDGQNDPNDIARLLEALKTNDVAYGVRAKRRDTRLRVIAGRLGDLYNDIFNRCRLVSRWEAGKKKMLQPEFRLYELPQ